MHTTPIFGFTAMEGSDPLHLVGDYLGQSMDRLEAILAGLGVAPTPDVTSLAAEIAARQALAARVAALDSNPWVNLTPAANWGTEPSNGGDIAQYRVEGRRVFLRGWMHSLVASNSGPMFTNLPAAIRPSRVLTAFGFWESAPQIIRINVQPDGTVIPTGSFALNQYVQLASVHWGLG